MEFKGTKGEWKITRSSTFETDISCGDVRITEVKHYNGSMFNDPSKEEGLENAKLIAAAPNLLGVCIHALEMCNDIAMPNENDLTIMAGRLKQAINKALK